MIQKCWTEIHKCRAEIHMDEIVTPYTTGILKDTNPLVHNQVLQDWCAFDLSEHVFLAVDPILFNAVHAFFTPLADQDINCGDAFHKRKQHDSVPPPPSFPQVKDSDTCYLCKGCLCSWRVKHKGDIFYPSGYQ